MYWNSAQGCAIKIGNKLLTEGVPVVSSVYANATIVDRITSDIETVPVDYTLDLKTSPDTLTISTNLPANADEAYRTFISKKQEAILNGGVDLTTDPEDPNDTEDKVVTGALNTETAYIFSAGYKRLLGACLSELNELSGPLINFIPSLGVTATTETAENNIITTIYTTCKCNTISERYNRLYLYEMIIYHGLNKTAWKLLRDSSENYVPGTWQQYQGLMAAWSLIAMRSQYIYSVSTLNESLGMSIGWVNPDCETYSFLVYADIEPDSSVDIAGLYKSLIVYPMGLVSNTQTNTTEHPQDANDVVGSATDGTIFFIAKNLGVSEGEPQGLVYTNTADTWDPADETTHTNRPIFNTAIAGFGTFSETVPEVIAETSCVTTGGPCNGAWYCIVPPNYKAPPKKTTCTKNIKTNPSLVTSYIVPESYKNISDPSQFNSLTPTSEDIKWKFRVGVIRYGVKAGDGYARQFYMGLPPTTTVAINSYDTPDKKRNKYSVSVTWLIKSNTSTLPPTDEKNTATITAIHRDLGTFDTIPVLAVQ